MEKVFLRVYNREIEGMIEGGQLDEAIAHCQHILKTFPMHVETYRLLGKAFLEARRYADAADIFQRVLMSVPDDFVSHVGMSIIRDDEGKLDDAIWHMERAFEVQPSNSAIQGELRRLYGRRDGTEPTKIRLSRDALANMYLQGELFNQAIAELRSVLADDPNRPDLQVMLMRSYFRSGHKVEAAELAATLLNKYPYCLDSLRVLVDVLPGTARAENTQVYRHRLFLLDPYSNFAKDSAFTSDQVPDSSINLERLDYKPDGMPSVQQPDWASSLGIKLNTEKHAEPIPGWMQNPEVPDKPTESMQAVSDSGIEPASNQAETAPEWMRSADWVNPLEDNKVTPPVSGEVKPDETVAKADIPDWLMSMAPKDVGEATNNEPEGPKTPLPIGEDGVPEWLKPITPASESEAAPIPPTENASAIPMETQAPSETRPASDDFIREPVNPIPPAKPVEEKFVEPQVAEHRVTIEPGTAGDEEVPDWLKSIASVEPVASMASETHEPAELQPQTNDGLPDWLKSIAPTGGVGEMDKVLQTNDELQPEGREEIPDKVESRSSSENLSETGTPASNVEPPPELPSKMAAPAVFAAAENETPKQSMPLEQPVPEETVSKATEKPIETEPGTVNQSFQPTGEVKPLHIEDDALGWLESLAAKQGAKPEELLTRPDERSIEMPDWLRQPGEEQAETPSISAQEPFVNPPTTMPLESQGSLGSASASVVDQTIRDSTIEKREEIPLPPPPEPVIQPVSQTTGNEEDTMSWLEKLSGDQEEPPSTPSMVESDKLETPLPETQPIKGKRLVERPPDEPTPSEPAMAPEELHPSPPTLTQGKIAPSELTPVQGELTPSTPAPAPAPASQEDITITSWLSKLDVEEALAKQSTAQPGEENPAISAEELPDWLKDIESPVKPVEPQKVSDDLPEWLRHPISSVESGSTSGSEVPGWVDENIPPEGQAAPTMPEEWIPAESKPEIIPEPVPVPKTSSAAENIQPPEPKPAPETTPFSEPEPASIPVQPSIQPPTTAQAGTLSTIPVQDKDSELLNSAQALLDQDSLNESMKLYMKLIKKGRLLDEVIHDLREAIYRYPVDVIIWQTLGDAYMRANRLQDALDAYNKAEELLR